MNKLLTCFKFKEYFYEIFINNINNTFYTKKFGKKNKYKFSLKKFDLFICGVAISCLIFAGVTISIYNSRQNNYEESNKYESISQNTDSEIIDSIKKTLSSEED